MEDQVEQSWEKFLNPQTFRANLISASLFITGYEILKDSIIQEIKSFYLLGFDETDPAARGPYEKEVLALDSKRKVFPASIAWLKANDVIDSSDEKAIIDLTDHRNKLAHRLSEFLSESGKDVESARLETLVSLVAKIDRWWIMNFELAIRNDIDSGKVDPNRISSGRMIILQMLLQTAAATDSTELYKMFHELQAKQKPPATK